MTKNRLFATIAFFILTVNAFAQTGYAVKGGLSLVNNDISMITAESIQNENNYCGFFIGPAITYETSRPLGLELGLFYQQTKMVKPSIPEDKVYKQEFLQIPASLKLRFGSTDFKFLAQAGPQWNINMGDLQKFMVDGKEILSDRIISTANIGAGVRVLDFMEFVMNFNVPWRVIGDNIGDFNKMSNDIGRYRTIQFVFGVLF